MNLSNWKKLPGREKTKVVLFYFTLVSAMLFFVFLQPLGEPPDESGRYLIVQYICLHGRLPHGADPEILLYGYGGSYGFQPMLTYIIQGFLLRFLFQFCQDGYLLLLAARLVNVVFGVIMAVYVRKTAKFLFQNESLQWLFSVLIMFLPQSLFLHTYVNTDSMAMMSTAMMVYAWLTGLKTHWDRRSCITLSIGISLCALSYYNAYGFILCSILLFAASFVTRDQVSGRPVLNWKEMLQKGLFISAIVLLCIGWWFIRNAVLYNGDFLGLSARAKCTLETATEKYHPLTKKTYQNTGFSLWYMIFETDFLELLTNSTIATFGPMSIVTFTHIYTVIKWLVLISLLGLLLPKRGPADESGLPAEKEKCLHGCMALSIVIPIVLCTGYSYMSDYQPQGRYILPMLIPFVYFMVWGLRKLTGALSQLINRVLGRFTNGQAKPVSTEQFLRILTTAVTCFYFYALWITLIRIVFPVYYPASLLRYIRELL